MNATDLQTVTSDFGTGNSKLPYMRMNTNTQQYTATTKTGA
jgi:hypothetical protein